MVQSLRFRVEAGVYVRPEYIIRDSKWPYNVLRPLWDRIVEITKKDCVFYWIQNAVVYGGIFNSAWRDLRVTGCKIWGAILHLLRKLINFSAKKSGRHHFVFRPSAFHFSRQHFVFKSGHVQGGSFNSKKNTWRGRQLQGYHKPYKGWLGFGECDESGLSNSNTPTEPPFIPSTQASALES